MASESAHIPVSSERQAHDWGLVLASQGIDTTIDQNIEAKTWELVVEQPDYPRALQAIRLYRKENHGRRLWQQELPFSGLILDWRAIVPMLLLVLLYAAEATGHGNLRQSGMM